LAAEKTLFLEIITSAVHRKEAGEFAEPGRVRVFDPIEAYDLPVYKEMKLAVPPFLEMLKYVYDAGFTHIHSATPGPMGLAALAVSRILKLPISGTYHTAIPQYAARLTKDESLEAYSWRFVIWYYAQMDFVYVPSLETGRELIAKGLPAEKVAPYPRGVDADRFHPRHGGDFYEHRYGLPPDSLVLLYVGRVSREKNLAQLAEAFRAIQTVRPECTLAVVGDGPYREEMAAELKGWPCLFTGYLDGDDLAAAYASADLFVFPSTTDTFGNVILEAQASGLPVVVTDGGGPRENMRPGQTGWVVPGDNAMALAEAVLQLLRSPEKLRDMAQRAREYAAQRSFEHAFMDQWRLYARPVPTFTGDPVPLDKAHAA
jgi:glycosyltransferase involved in cell wall biosynthesis